jgi:hypothetical protein
VKTPYILGGCLLFVGYYLALATRVDWIFPPEVVRFRRKEQMRRLRAFIFRTR